MIRKLQKKFISITAAALFAVILLVLAAVNGIFFFQSNRQLDRRLEMIMNEYLNTPPDMQLPDSQQPDSQQPNMQQPGSERQHTPQEPKDALPHFGNRLLIRADGCVVCLDEDETILEIRQDEAKHYTEEELSSVTAALLKKGHSQGWHRYFKFRILTLEEADGRTLTLIGLLNASSDLYAVFTMLLISAVIGIVCFLLVLLIIISASGHAVKPIAESYARQKQFVTDAGHELKTPLTVISANSELARMIYGDNEWFDSIDRQVGKMNGLVRSLITLAKLDEEQKPAFVPFSLSDAVYDTAKSFEGLLRPHGNASQGNASQGSTSHENTSPGASIAYDIAENIAYTGDESRLRQLVSILMDNAVKYCDPGGSITVRLFRDKQIRLQIINDFAAAADCELDRVFERFYRADKARTSDGSYGLGLSIAKSIVELHKGEIRTMALEHGQIMFEVKLAAQP